MTTFNPETTAPAKRQTAHIISLSELAPPSNGGRLLAASDVSLIDATNPLHQVKTPVSVCVGSVVLSIGELLNAQKDQVLKLDSLVQDPVDLLVEGKVIARGVLVAMDDHFAVRITDVPETLTV